MALKILQVNAQRSVSVAGELKVITREKDIDVLIVQEPYAYRGKVKGYAPLSARVVQATDDSGIMAAIIVYQEDVVVTQMSQWCTKHMVCAHLCTKEGEFYVVSLYCQFSHEIEKYLQKVEEMIDEIGSDKVILGADVNAKSTLWYSGECDYRGERVEELITTKRLVVMNEPNNPPTFWTRNGSSCIDITLAGQYLSKNIYNWKVNENWCNSDHNCIYFEYVGRVNEKRKIYKNNGYNIRSADWEMFEKLTRKKFNKEKKLEIDKLTSEEAVNEVTRSVQAVCSKSIRRRKTTTKAVPWWTKELTIMRKEVNNRRKHVQRCKRLMLLDEVEDAKLDYSRRRNKYHKMIKVMKRDSWEKFVTTNTSEDPWGFVYKLTTEKLKKTEVYHTINDKGEGTKNWIQSMESIMQYLVPLDTICGEQTVHGEIREICDEYVNENVDPPISSEEISIAVRKLADKKAPGPDHLNPEIVKRFWTICPDVLISVFNKCYADGVFPNQWKIAELRIIMKGVDRDPRLPSSYRPIALLPVMGKVFERIILNRFQKMYDTNEMASRNQYGFKVGSSTEDALYSAVWGIKTSQMKYVVGIFIDIKGAFDNLWWYSILHRVLQTNCSSTMYRVFKSYFTDRYMIVNSKFDSIKRQMSKGCPQGSIIGPVAWNIVMDKLLEKRIEDCDFIAYADDLLILIHGETRKDIELKADKVLRQIKNWCNEQKLEISAPKTKIMMFKGKMSKTRLPIIKCDGKTLKYSAKHKYLGVILDDKLNFIEHVKYMKGKIKKLYGKIMRIARPKWGLNRRTLNLIYDCVFKSVLSYGAGAWYHVVQHTHVRRQIDSSQRFALMSMTRTCKTVSTAALQVLAGKMPIDLEITIRGIGYMVRTRRKVVWGNYNYNTPQVGEIINRKRKDLERSKMIETAMSIWQDRWNNETKGRITYKFIPNVRDVEEKKWLQLGLRVTFLVTGHGTINNYLYKIKRASTPECPSCKDAIETVNHMVLECNAYEDVRPSLVREIQMQDLNEERGFSKLVETEDNYKTFVEFVDRMYKLRNSEITE